MLIPMRRKKGQIEKMVFGGKKQLEEEVAELKVQNLKMENLMKELRSRKGEVEEQFATLAASHAQMTQHMEQISEQVGRVAELASESQAAASDVHSTMMGVNNAVESFGATHSVFLGQLKNQNEKISEFLEQHRGYGTTVEKLSEVQTQMKEAQEKTKQTIKEMKEYGKTMGVLALNAAIEAGRMGEAGLSFINAAEEVRSYSEKYEQSAEIMKEELKASKARVAELEEEVEKLKALFKDCTIAVGKLYSTGVQNLSAYEAGQIDLRESISGSTVGRADALKQAGEEFIHLQEQLNGQLKAAKEEMNEQKNCSDELETIYKDLQKTAEHV